MTAVYSFAQKCVENIRPALFYLIDLITLRKIDMQNINET